MFTRQRMDRGTDMLETGSVSQLICDVRNGSETAATELWARYQTRLLQVARSRVGHRGSVVADEEDVVVMAFQSFLQRTAAGNFPKLSNRDELWRLLVAITARKAINQVRDQEAQKRRREKSLTPAALAEIASSIPTPEFVAIMDDELSFLLDRLGDDELREIVKLRLEGYSCQEIAGSINRSLSTVERRLHLVREKWRFEFDEPVPENP